MLKIRLQRVGRKHDPSYRVVLIDSRKGPKSGSFLENLGFYDTIRKVKQIKADRVKHWIANGAQVSDTVHNILISEKIIEGKKINVLPKKTPIIKETEDKEEAPASASDSEAVQKTTEDVSPEETKEPSVTEAVKKKEVKEDKTEEKPVSTNDKETIQPSVSASDNEVAQ